MVSPDSCIQFEYVAKAFVVSVVYFVELYCGIYTIALLPNLVRDFNSKLIEKKSPM